ncbi:hypothetical protein HRI_002423800 [Hibiscus trionum]|uniref:Uncharacterized protein n=1 Tax=Hibiscus trionum TaxID=183268 RepID=A0A9W7M6L7_HIBTR|nr:hypothetical protein HRI_002423800 [Hibiscus trionum]
MAAERVITCLFILVLFAAFISFVQANQDSNHKTAPTVKELVNDANKNWVIRGRKMVQMKKLTATKLSKCGGNGGESNSGCEQMSIDLSDEADDHQSGFVAFNADYHAPRHHPPKNN